MEEELTEIHCPLTVIYTSKKTGRRKERVCGVLCIKVYPGSRGEAWCSLCKKTFDFELRDQSDDYMTINKQSLGQDVE